MQDDNAILSRIRKEKSDFVIESIPLAPGYFYNQMQTVSRIDNYLHSRFESGPVDDDGWPKPFYNIVRKPCAVASKEIDLDTKDIIIRPENGDYETADIMAAEFKQWMKDEGFAADLNEYADLCPAYGSVVVKKVRESLHTVNLKMLSLSNVQAKTLDNTNIIETHTYAREEFISEAKKLGWDDAKVTKVLAAYDKANKVDITVDERYGWVKESELTANGKETMMVYSMCIAAGTDVTEEIDSPDGKAKIVEERGVVLKHEKIDKHPYREWHWSRMAGRWLGVGFTEMLFDAQVRQNEIAYYKAKALQWIGVHLFASDDDTVTKNLMNDLKNGDVVRLVKNGQLTEIQMQERNLSYYGSEETRWDKNAADQTFTPEIITGEGLPSGTPARSAIISDQNVKRYYDRKREDFGIWIRDIIIDEILPRFEKDRDSDHVFSFSGTGTDRDAIERRVFNARMVALFQDYITQKGRIPSRAEWRRAMLSERQKLANSPTIDIDIPAGAYKNLKKRLDVVITKENEDTDSKLAGRQAVLKVLATNPNLASNPATRSIFLELANLMGVKALSMPSPAEILSTATPATIPGAGAAPGGETVPAGADVLNNIPVPA